MRTSKQVQQPLALARGHIRKIGDLWVGVVVIPHSEHHPFHAAAKYEPVYAAVCRDLEHLNTDLLWQGLVQEEYRTRWQSGNAWNLQPLLTERPQ